MADERRLEVQLPAEPASVPVLRAEARAYATAVGLPADAVGMLALAVTEAATNAVVHAFVGSEPGRVELHAEPGDGELVVTVRDDGRGLTPRHDSPGLGLGLPTIGRCCTHLDIAEGPGGHGTEVRMCFAAPQVRAPARDQVRRRLEEVLGAVDDAITVSGPDGAVVFANAAAAELLGAAGVDEVLAAAPRTLAERFTITHEDGRPVTLGELPHVQVLAGRPAQPLLTRSVLKATGRARWLLTTSRPLEQDGALLAVNTIRDVTAQKDAELRQRFLAEASTVLASSLELRETFQHVADLAVPALADWCAVDVATPDALLERVALAHTDPEKVRLGREIHERWPPDPSREDGVYGVLRTGEPLFLEEVPDEVLEQGTTDPEHLALLREIGLRSVLLVPMSARGAVLGVLTLVTAESLRTMTRQDVELAADVARRAGVAIDTARRFSER